MEFYCNNLRVASITFLLQKIYHIQSVMSTIQPHNKVDIISRQRHGYIQGHKGETYHDSVARAFFKRHES